MQEIAEARKHTIEKDNKTKVIATIAAVMLVAGGVTGDVAWHNRQEAVQAACSASLKDAKAARAAWLKLVDGDAKTTTKTDKGQVKNAKTLDTLAAELKAKAPTITAYAGDTADRVGKAAKRISLETAWYVTHTKNLKQAVEAVQASRVDKTVADAQALFDSTAGKVADEAIRTMLKEAIGKRGTKATAEATGKINASVKAKADADAVKATAEAAAQATQAQRNTGSFSSTSRRSSGQTYSHSSSSTAGS